MKRIMFILSVVAALLFVSNVNAQVIRLGKDITYASYTGVAGDTAKTTTAKYFSIFVNKDYLYHYEVQVSVDSSGDGTNFSVQLSGSMDESNWYTIGSAITYGVVSTDTVMRFTNIPTAETWTVAQHTITTATATDYHNGQLARYDTSAGGEVASYRLDDTVTAAARTATVAAQTYTINKTLPVGWRYLRIGFTGAGSGARCEIERITCVIRRN